MKIALFSDVHADVKSLKKVIRFLRFQGIADIYCLGDIIGYGKHPNEVISILKKEKIKTIKGNHEKIFLSGKYLKKYNLDYTKKIITKASLEYIHSLPEAIELKSCNAILSHAVPGTKDSYHYANSDFSVFDAIKHKIIFLGHSHYPMLMAYRNKKIINPGSIGQPRDGNDKPSFVICDLKKQIFEFLRI